MLTVTTQDATVITIDYRPYDDSGLRLFVRLLGRTRSDHTEAGGVLDNHWHLLNVLNPIPPLIGQELLLVLQAENSDAPIVHRTATVMSVVGTL